MGHQSLFGRTRHATPSPKIGLAQPSDSMPGEAPRGRSASSRLYRIKPDVSGFLVSCSGLPSSGCANESTSNVRPTYGFNCIPLFVGLLFPKLGDRHFMR